MNFVRRIKENVTVTLNGVVRAIIHYGDSHGGADDSRYLSWDFPEKGGSKLLQNADTYVRVLSGILSQKFGIFEAIMRFKTCWIRNLNSPISIEVCPCLLLLRSWRHVKFIGVNVFLSACWVAFDNFHWSGVLIFPVTLSEYPCLIFR